MSIQFCEACCEEKEIDSMICTDCQVEQADIEAEDAARLRARIEVLERQRDGMIAAYRGALKIASPWPPGQSDIEWAESYKDMLEAKTIMREVSDALL